MIIDFVPILIMFLVASGLALTFLKLAEVLGPKRPSALKASPYESGMDPVGSARERFSVKFYLIAMIFIVFDVEIVFMYPWAVSFNEFIASGAGIREGIRLGHVRNLDVADTIARLLGLELPSAAGVAMEEIFAEH